uniref:AAA+ ATPase domain-containing protein n=1 Tax=Plectus sambesii TaxID=2011161 RepID=A0A914WHF9_9BILA
MSKAKNKRGLVACHNCDCFLSAKHLEKHNGACSADRPLSSSLPTTLTAKSFHPFIIDKWVLYGQAEGVKDCKDAQASAGWAKRNTILVHPAVSEQMELRPRAPCILFRDNRLSTAIVWPSESVGELRVGLLNESKVAETLTILRPIDTQSVLLARRVVLTPVGPWKRFFETDEFRYFLNAYFVGAYLDIDTTIVIQYFGQQCKFVIEAYDVGGDVRRKRADAEVDKLVDSVQEISLDSTQEVPLDSVHDKSLDSSTLNATAMFSTPPSTPVRPRNTSRASTATPTRSITDNVSIPAAPSLPAVIIECDIQTEFSIPTGVTSKSKQEKPIKTFSDVGGMSLAKRDLRTQVIEPLTRDGATAVQPILICGPTGCGKSLLLEAVVGELQATDLVVIQLAASELLSRYLSDSEKAMQKITDRVEEGKRSLLIVNDLDVVMMGGKESEAALKIASLLCSFIDSTTNVTLLATVRTADRLDDALRRRFALEIDLPVPSAEERAEILGIILQQLNVERSDAVMSAASDIAQTTHGFTGADLAAVCKVAAVGRGADIAEQLRVAAKRIRPSALREIILEVPKVRWTEVGGQEQLKLQLQQAVEWPLRHPEAFTRLGVPAPTGILLYGPPGCSKTLIARALATESGLNFLAVKGPELFSKWVGESERAVRELFRRARQVAPAIVFFDEIDALAVTRASQKEGGGSGVGDRVLAQLLTELDGLEPLGGVTIVAATNRPDVIDRALLRPGRLDQSIYVPLPDEGTRRAIVHLQLERIPAAADVNVETIVAKTAGYSGAEVVAVCRNAAMAAMRADLNVQTVSMIDFVAAVDRVKPRSDRAMLALYDSFSRAIVE